MRLSCIRKIFMVFTLAVAFNTATAQTVLLNPLLDGGFENGSTFSSNGWQTANAATNKWFVGTGAVPYHGSRCAYIDNGTGATNNYTITTNQTSHIYRDITFPANEPRIVLTFKWKANGQALSTTDFLTVFGMSTSLTPAANVPSGSQGITYVDDSYAGAEILSSPAGLYSSTTWQTQRVLLPESYAGTTKRIVFMWSNNASQGTGEAASIDSISIVTYANRTCVSLPKTGSWADPGMWVNGFQPTSNDTAIISSGSEITSQVHGTSIANVKIESDATLVSVGTLTLNNIDIDNGGVFRLYNDQGVCALTVNGNVINNGRIDMNNPGCSLKLNGTSTQYINGIGVFENGHIPTFQSLGSNVINISQDIAISKAFDLNGSELTGTGRVILGNALHSNVFNFTSRGGRINPAKIVTGNFSSVKNVLYRYSPSASATSYTTGNELATNATGIISMTIDNMGGAFLKLGTNAGVNDMYFSDSLDLNGYSLEANGNITFTGVSAIMGNGSFRNGDLSTILISSPQGITQTAALGNVQSAVRNYSKRASYRFAAGVTGDGLPDTLTAGTVTMVGAVKLSRNTTFNHLVLNSNFDADAFNIRVNGTATISGYYISGTGSFTTASGSKLILTQNSGAGLILANGSSGNIRVTGGISILPGTSISMTAATLLGSGFPATGIDTLTVLQTMSVISQPLTVNHLVFDNNGTLTTTLNNPFIVNGALIRKTPGTINGPLTRRIDSSLAGSIDFPVGALGFNQNFSLINPSVAGTHVYATVWANSRNFTPVNGPGITAVKSDYVWTLTYSGPGVLKSADHLKLASNILGSTNTYRKIAMHKGNTPSGVYNSIGGYSDVPNLSIISARVDSLSSTDTNYFAVVSGAVLPVFPAGTYTVGDTGTYRTINSALAEIGKYDSIGGPVIIELLPGYQPNKESYPLVFNGNLHTSEASSITLRPAANVTSVFRLNNSNPSKNAIIEFSQDARYIIIDGRPGGVGTAKLIEIDQTSVLYTGTVPMAIPAVSMFDKAQRITLKHLKISAINSSATSGVVVFGTSAFAGTDAGNSYNIIDHCVINGNANAVSFGRYGVSSANGIYSSGSASAPNIFNTITNTDLLDCYSPLALSAGSSFINIAANSSNWMIGGNRLYYTQPVTAGSVPAFMPLSQVSVIKYLATGIDSTQIKGNEIGGNASIPGSTFAVGDSLASGTASSFYGISVTNGIRISISENKINNISLYGVAPKLIESTNGGIIEKNVIGSLQAGSVEYVGTPFIPQQSFVGISLANAFNNAKLFNNSADGISVRSNSNVPQARMTIQVFRIAGLSNVSITSNKIGTLTPNSIQALPVGLGAITLEGIGFMLSDGNYMNLPVKGNTIKNLSNFNPYKSIVNGIGVTASGSYYTFAISGNEISNLSSVSESISGIYSTNAFGRNNHYIANNHIHSLNSQASTGVSVLNGIMLQVNGSVLGPQDTRVTVDANKIHSFTCNPLNNNNTFNGIFCSGSAEPTSGPIVISNNLVRLGIDAQGAGVIPSIEINGLRSGIPSGNNIVNNTLYIGGNNVAGGDNKTSVLYTTGINKDSISNNIFYNARSNASGTTASHYILRTANAPACLARNIYYASGTGNSFALLGATSLARFQQWQALSQKDTTSINLNPMLVNPAGNAATFNLKPSGVTPAESNGTLLNAPVYDIDSSIRATLTPVDIGAYAGNFTKTDVDGPIITATNVSNTHLRSNRIVTATITDETGVAIAGAGVPRLYYKKMMAGTYASAQGTLMSGTGKNGTWNFSIDTSLITGLAYNDSIYYFFVAQDTSVHVNLSSMPLFATGSHVNSLLNEPPSLFNYKIFESAAGNYLVGASQTAPNFTTITAAKSFLESRLITDDVNFLLQGDYNAASEPAFPIVLNRFLSNSDSNTVTIKPDAGVNATISGNGLPSIFKLFAARNYIIDGSNNGSDSRNLILVNTNTSLNGNTVIHLSGTASVDSGSAYNVIKNCIIQGTYNTNANPCYGVFLRGDLLTSLVSPGNNYNQVINNLIYNVTKGVVLETSSSSMYNVGNVIRNNVIGKSELATEQVGQSAISASMQKNLEITGNSIGYSIILSSSTKSFSEVHGIFLQSVFSSKVNRNFIHHLLNEKRSFVYGIYANTFDSTRNVYANNVIHSIRSNRMLAGIRINNGIEDSIVYNSCVINDSLNKVGMTPITENSAAVYLTNSNLSVICNNVFVCDAKSTDPAVKHAAFWAMAGPSFFTSLKYFDRNLFYVPAGNTQSSIGLFVSQPYTLADLRVSGHNVNSSDLNPLFNSFSNLIPDKRSPLLNMALAIPGIDKDITGAQRSSTPTAGAYEYAVDSVVPVITLSGVLNTASVANRVVSASITDNTGIHISGPNKPRIYFKKMNAGSWQSLQGSLVSGNGLSGTWSFTIDHSLLGGVAISDSVYYYIAAQDSSPAGNTGTFPVGGIGVNVNSITVSKPLNYAVFQAVSGNFLVGASQTAPNFTTITAASSFIQGKILTGNVNFLLQSDYNAAQEPAFPIVFKPYISSQAPGTFKVTLKPDAGVTDTITGSSNTSVLKIEDGDYYVIDGSNNGTKSRDLTIINTNSSNTTSAGIWLSSLGENKGASNNTIKNLNISGTVGPSFLFYAAGLCISGPNLTNFGFDNDSNIISGNYLKSMRYGIVSVGGNNTNLNYGNVISNNILGPETIGTDPIIGDGIIVSNEENAIISGNEIRNFGGAFNSPYGITPLTGIQLGINNFATPYTVAVYQKKVRVSNNLIHHLHSEKATSVTGIAVSSYFNEGPRLSENVIANNIIYDLLSNIGVNDGAGASGMTMEYSRGDSILHNTIILEGDIDPPGAVVSTGNENCYGIYVGVSGVERLNIANNIISVNLTSSNSEVRNNVYGSYQTSTSFTGVQFCNYNSVYVNPSNRGAIARFGRTSTPIAAATWKNSYDQNSVYTSPLFNQYSVYTLREQSPLIGAGFYIRTTDKDYNDSIRRNPPTIGAFEYPYDYSGPSIQYIPIKNTKELSNYVLNNFAYIKDTSGVNTSSGLKPRIYFKKATEADVFGANSSLANGWKWVEASNTVSPFSFIIDYSLLSSVVAPGDSIKYFVTAQDLTTQGFVNTNPGNGFAASSIAAFTKAPDSLMAYLIVDVPMNGNYNIGKLETWPNFKTIKEAVHNLTLRGVDGPVTLTLVDTLYTTPTETFPIAIKKYEGVSATNTIILRPGAAARTRILSSSSNTFTFDNTSYFIIDGRLNGSGAPLSLWIHNSLTSAFSTLSYNNDSRNNKVLYTDVTAAITGSSAFGAITLGVSALPEGNDSILIKGCHIHSGSASSSTSIGISSFTNSSVPTVPTNDYLFIDSCSIYDFAASGNHSYGIYIARGKGIQITNNRFYQSNARSFSLLPSSSPSEHRAIFVDKRTDADDSIPLIVSHNTIGSNGSTGNYTISGDHRFYGIDLLLANASRASIQGNKVEKMNISCKTALADAVQMIRFSSGRVELGNEVPNVVGSAASNGSISFIAAAANAGMFGISAYGYQGLVVRNNIVAGIDLAAGAVNMGANFTGIALAGSGEVKNNTVGSATVANSINQTSASGSNTQSVKMRGFSTTGTNLIIDSNLVANLNNSAVSSVNGPTYENDVTGIAIIGGSATISNNRIFNLSSSTQTNGGYKGNINGILSLGGASTIRNNSIHSLKYTSSTTSSNSVSLIGINLLGSSQVIADANNIRSFSVNNGHNGNQLYLSGIYSYTSSAVLSNNMISLGLDENGNSVSVPCGIWGIVANNESGMCKVIHNSVYIGGVSNGTSISITRTFTHLNNNSFVRDTIVNNIFSNMRTNNGAGIKHYNVYVFNYKNILLDRNVYQKTPTGIFGTANAMTSDTVNYRKGWVASDNESVMADPQFINPAGSATSTDLHIRNNVPTPVEAAGYVLKMDADFDGEQRSTLSPVDIGADAGNFIRQDLLPPVITYNPLKQDTVSLQRYLSGINITDATGVDTAWNKRPRLYFKKRSNNNAFVGNTSTDNGWKYVIANNTASPFNFNINYSLLYGSALALNDTIDYFVTAQDSSAGTYVGANPAYGFNATGVGAITSAPANPNYYRIYHLPLNGIYHVGSGHTSPNFATITAAVERMTDVGVTGKVTFNLTDNLYSSNETFPIVINTINGASAQNTVTMKPASPGTRIIGNTITNAELIRLNNVAYFKIDGSVNGSGSRDLTIDNTGDGRAIYFYSTSDNAIYDTIANTTLSGSKNSSALLIGGNTTYLRMAVVNNKFIGSLNGVKAEGSGARSWLYILNNQFGDSLPENNLYTTGVNVVGAEAVQIIGNRVTNVRNQVNTTTYGIFASSEGGRIIGNTVDYISDTGTWFTEYAAGIDLVANAGQVINNMVSGITANNSIGIVSGGTVLHNTVHMNTKRPGVLNTYASSAAVGISGAELRNNIFINSMTCSAPSASTTNSIFTNNGSINYSLVSNNNYYIVPASAPMIQISYQAATMADWRTLANDTTSRNVPVTFVSATDLHLAGTSVGDTNLKAPFSWFAEKDIDGDARNTFFTYMGADENTGNPVPVKLLQFTATRKAADVELNWSTASENNNYGFDIERSADGKHFEKISFIKGALVSAGKNNYQSIDERAFINARANTLYYRLKQLDMDGRYTYSAVAIVNNPLSKPIEVAAYPNPFGGSLKVSLTSETENEGTIALRDLNGKLVYTAAVQLKAGENELEVHDLGALNAGMYFMSIVTPGKTAVIKVIKQ